MEGSEAASEAKLPSFLPEAKRFRWWLLRLKMKGSPRSCIVEDGAELDWLPPLSHSQTSHEKVKNTRAKQDIKEPPSNESSFSPL